MPVAEERFYSIVQDTWAATLGFQVDRHPGEETTPPGGLSVGVRITGAWEGEVRLYCPLPLARSIAAAIFQTEADQVGSDEILDALSELVHIIGGNLKPLLPPPVNLSLPSPGDGEIPTQSPPPGQDVCRLSLTSEGHPFFVTFWGDIAPSPHTPPPSDYQGAPSAEAR
jgi:hypothetical protein